MKRPGLFQRNESAGEVSRCAYFGPGRNRAGDASLAVSGTLLSSGLITRCDAFNGSAAR